MQKHCPSDCKDKLRILLLISGFAYTNPEDAIQHLDWKHYLGDVSKPWFAYLEAYLFTLFDENRVHNFLQNSTSESVLISTLKATAAAFERFHKLTETSHEVDFVHCAKHSTVTIKEPCFQFYFVYDMFSWCPQHIKSLHVNEFRFHLDKKLRLNMTFERIILHDFNSLCLNYISFIQQDVPSSYFLWYIV